MFEGRLTVTHHTQQGTMLIKVDEPEKVCQGQTKHSSLFIQRIKEIEPKVCNIGTY